MSQENSLFLSQQPMDLDLDEELSWKDGSVELGRRDPTNTEASFSILNDNDSTVEMGRDGVVRIENSFYQSIPPFSPQSASKNSIDVSRISLDNGPPDEMDFDLPGFDFNGGME